MTPLLLASLLTLAPELPPPPPPPPPMEGAPQLSPPPPPAPDSELQRQWRERRALLVKELAALDLRLSEVAQPSMPALLGAGTAYVLLSLGILPTAFGLLLALFAKDSTVGLVIAGVGGLMLVGGLVVALLVYSTEDARLTQRTALSTEKRGLQGELKDLELKLQHTSGERLIEGPRITLLRF